MKKFFLIAAAAAMVLSSCSKNTVSNDASADNLIGFGVYTGRLTKADPSTFIPNGQTYLPAGTSFGVYCYSTTADHFADVKTTALPNYMANQMVTYNVSKTEAPTSSTIKEKYTYTPTKYWPKKINGVYVLNLTFYAYYPFNSSAITTKPDETSAGLTGFEYTVPDAVASQPDFMLSELVADQTYESNSGNVHFIFHHVLSQIQVSAKIDDETNRNATVTITGIVFNNLNNHGTVTPGYDGTNTTFKWGTTDGSKDYSVSPSSPITLGTTDKDCTTDENTILTVPQKFPDDATVEITYTIQGNGGSAKTVTVTVPLKNIVTEEGKCTNFDFTISLFDTEKPITFTAEVKDWVADNRPTTI
jgi:hypothetical protein